MRFVGFVLLVVIALSGLTAFAVWKDGTLKSATGSTRLILSSLVKRSDQMQTMVEEGVVDPRLWRSAFEKYQSDLEFVVTSYQQQGQSISQDLLDKKEILTPLLENAFNLVEKANGLPNSAVESISKIRSRLETQGAIVAERLIRNKASPEIIIDVQKMMTLIAYDHRALTLSGEFLIEGDGTESVETMRKTLKKITDGIRVRAIAADQQLNIALADFSRTAKELKKYRELAEERRAAFRNAQEAFQSIGRSLNSLGWVEAHQKLEQDFKTKVTFGPDLYLMLSLVTSAFSLVGLLAWAYAGLSGNSKKRVIEKMADTSLGDTQKQKQLLDVVRNATNGNLGARAYSNEEEVIGRIGSGVNELILLFRNNLMECEYIVQHIEAAAQETTRHTNELTVKRSSSADAVQGCLAELNLIRDSSHIITGMSGHIRGFMDDILRENRASSDTVERASGVSSSCQETQRSAAMKCTDVLDSQKDILALVERLYDANRLTVGMALNLSILASDAEGEVQKKLSGFATGLNKQAEGSNAILTEVVDSLRGLLDQSREAVFNVESAAQLSGDVMTAMKSIALSNTAAKNTVETFQRDSGEWGETVTKLMAGAETIYTNVRDIEHLTGDTEAVSKSTTDSLRMLVSRTGHLVEVMSRFKSEEAKSVEALEQDTEH